MKKLFVIGCLFICFVQAFSQDIIYLYDGSEISAKVEEVNEDIVKYHKFNNINGPSYTINKSAILMIVYENGNKDIFSKQSTQNHTMQQKNYIDGQSLVLSGGKINYNGKEINEYEYLSLAYHNCPNAYKQYKIGKDLRIAGAVTMPVGMLLTMAGSIMYVRGDRYNKVDLKAAGTAFIIVGVPTLIAGIPLMCVGVHKGEISIQMYKDGLCQTSPYKFTIKTNGIAFAF